MKIQNRIQIMFIRSRLHVYDSRSLTVITIMSALMIISCHDTLFIIRVALGSQLFKVGTSLDCLSWISGSLNQYFETLIRYHNHSHKNRSVLFLAFVNELSYE